MIQYILECIAFQLVFLVIYDFFLKRETFFQWNRFYLLGTHVLSLILPWIKIEAFKTDTQVFSGYSEFLWNMAQPEVALTPKDGGHFSISWQEGIFCAGALLAAIWFGVKLWRLYKLRSVGKVSYFKDFTQILIPKSYIAFSFFRSIFLGEKIVGREYDSVVSHELVHIRQWHSLDLMFFEVMRIVSWFNPMVYVYQQRITELHEFIADSQVTKKEKSRHYEILLSQMFEVQHISFVNPFFKSSLIKKRIVMLQKSRSKRVWQLKYLVLVPLVLGMLFYTSCEKGINEKDKATENISLNDRKLIQELNEEINQKIEKQGSISNVYLSEDLPKRYKSLEKLSKRDFFEYKILYKQYLNELLTVSYPSMGESASEKVLERVEKMPLPSTDEYNYYLENLNESYVSQNILLGENTFSFGSVQEVPVFPGCENASDKRACFNDKIIKHISKNFRYPEEAQENGIQGRVSALFLISDNGNIENIKLRGPDKLLEDEVERILNRLPVMVPGKHEGEAVAVAYSIPINFKLQDDNEQSSNDNSVKDYLQVSGGLTVENGNSIFKGKVMDSESMGVPGVNIEVEGTNNAVISDFEGQFSVKVSEGKILKFQYEGLPEKRMLVSR